MSNVEETYMIPHGGIATGINRPYKERSIDVLFCGTYEAPEVYLKEINMCDGMIKTIALGVIDIMLKNCGMCIENAIYKFLEENLEENELTNIKSIMPDIMKDLAWVTDMYVRCFNRQLFIKKLLNLGICVHVYGKGWEDFKSEHSENLIVGGEINFEQSLKLMSDAKFVLNIMPGFKRGTHERVFCAMANGAVCATECTSYFSASFKENKEIIFFSLDNIEELADKLKYYLEHTDEAAQIAENGYKKVISEHMWKNRAVELLRTIE
jgi:hypothetical protein